MYLKDVRHILLILLRVFELHQDQLSLKSQQKFLSKYHQQYVEYQLQI